MRLRLIAQRLWPTTLILNAIFSFSVQTLGQQNSSNTPSDPKRAAEVEQAIRNFYKAIAQGDRSFVDSFIIDGGFVYESGNSTMTGAVSKAQTYFVMANMNHYSFEPSNFSFAIFGEVVVANYRLESKSLINPKEIILGQITDTLVRHNGRWQILAEHDSSVPNPIEPVIYGIPKSWQRSTDEGADHYQITVDNSIKHTGNASASIKLVCGSEQDIWVALIQSITADKYRGKRLRFSGWVKTNDVTGSGLWMRVDGERQTLAFDNMVNRSITGTTDWKLYSVVLDVPDDAKSIVFGVVSMGPGQTWADDLKLELVDNSVASTNLALPEVLKQDQPSILKSSKVINPLPLNLGFEDGTVH